MKSHEQEFKKLEEKLSEMFFSIGDKKSKTTNYRLFENLRGMAQSFEEKLSVLYLSTHFISIKAKTLKEIFCLIDSSEEKVKLLSLLYQKFLEIEEKSILNPTLKKAISLNLTFEQWEEEYKKARKIGVDYSELSIQMMNITAGDFEEKMLVFLILKNRADFDESSYFEDLFNSDLSFEELETLFYEVDSSVEIRKKCFAVMVSKAHSRFDYAALEKIKESFPEETKGIPFKIVVGVEYGNQGCPI